MLFDKVTEDIGLYSACKSIVPTVEERNAIEWSQPFTAREQKIHMTGRCTVEFDKITLPVPQSGTERQSLREHSSGDGSGFD